MGRIGSIGLMGFIGLMVGILGIFLIPLGFFLRFHAIRFSPQTQVTDAFVPL
jgi:hypothetical protein